MSSYNLDIGWKTSKVNLCSGSMALLGLESQPLLRHLQRLAFAEGKLGASFFCSRDFEDRSNLQSIFPTLALPACISIPPFREAFAPSLEGQPWCWTRVTLFPVGEAHCWPIPCYTNISTLIIIDALDECQGQGTCICPPLCPLPLCGQDPQGQVLHHWSGLNPGFVLDFVYNHCSLTQKCSNSMRLNLKSVDSDIKLFLKAQFFEIAKNRSDCDLGEDWPGQHNIDVVCARRQLGFSSMLQQLSNLLHPTMTLPDERLALIVSLPHETFS
jgi:hypothetical protein